MVPIALLYSPSALRELTDSRGGRLATHTTSPMTGQELESTQLIPNRSLKHAIERFAASNGITIAAPVPSSSRAPMASPTVALASSSKSGSSGTTGTATGVVMDFDNRTIRAQGIVGVYADGGDLIEIEIDRSVPARIFMLLLEFWYSGIATLNGNKVGALALLHRVIARLTNGLIG